MVSKVVPCPHRKPRGRKVCDRCRKQRKREADHRRYYSKVRKEKVSR